MDALGESGSEYRLGLYERAFSGARDRVGAGEIVALCDISLAHLDRTLRANRRPDGLYHAYGVLRLGASAVGIGRLPLMLEGQVAALSSGTLEAEEAADLLAALRASELYRADQASYLLYPDRWIKPFLEKNNIPEARGGGSRLIQALLARGNGGIVERDEDGGLHFGASLRNARALEDALGELAENASGDALAGELSALAEAEAPLLLELYEEVFDHRSFTGRSGTFCKYEGLGCVYWHMVSKLLVAVQETIARARDEGSRDARARDANAVLSRLESAYREIREGIGTHKSPADYGAFPTDPYSHTPSFVGVQQPGMTGQAKEDIISRFGELGARVEEGRLRFDPSFAAEDEFLSGPRDFSYVDALGQERIAALGAGSYAFTICQVLVVAHRADGSLARVDVGRADGSSFVVPGTMLDPEASAAIFDRSGEIARLDVFFDSAYYDPSSRCPTR